MEIYWNALVLNINNYKDQPGSDISIYYLSGDIPSSCEAYLILSFLELIGVTLSFLIGLFTADGVSINRS
jgi:hypothetical protein